MKKKIKASKEKNLEELEEPEAEKNKEQEMIRQEKIISALSHTGEYHYQVLMKLQELNLLVERIAKAEERRNEIAEEEYSDEEEEDED